jgi:hypothetical protein
MSAVLEATKFFWEVIKDGAKVDVRETTVSVLPKGASKDDFGGWKWTSFSEKYEELSFLFESELADFTLTAEWEYNGEYIANFHVTADGTVDVLSNINIAVNTFEAEIDDEGVAQLPYHVTVQFHNLTGGTRRKTFKAVARGDGGGMSLF